MCDGLPRSEGTHPFNAFFPSVAGRCTLADIYTDNHGQGGLGMFSQFDMLRHPKWRMNVVFCDGHVESLVINERDLVHGVLVAN